jgi:HlyD family secretion protein
MAEITLEDYVRAFDARVSRFIPPSNSWTPVEEALIQPLDMFRVPLNEAEGLQLATLRHSFQLHFSRNATYRNYCLEHGITPDDICTTEDLEKIPLISDRFFKEHHNVDEAEQIVEALKTPPSEAKIEAAQNAVELVESLMEQSRKQFDSIEKKTKNSNVRLAAQLAVYAAEREYYQAVSYLNALQSTPKESDILRAEANLEIAQVQLRHAQTQYELLKKGPDPDLMDLAEARLKNSQAQLAAAQKSLVELELKSPFAGTIVSIEIKEGQSVNQAIPAITLADLKKWQVETTDLLESDLRYIEIGMPARITLEAFPESEFEGWVESIELYGVESRGAASYTVRFNFDPGDADVRWRMTAFIDIPVNGE